MKRQVVFELDGSGQPTLTFVRENGERVITHVYPKPYWVTAFVAVSKWLEKGEL